MHWESFLPLASNLSGEVVAEHPSSGCANELSCRPSAAHGQYLLVGYGHPMVLVYVFEVAVAAAVVDRVAFVVAPVRHS